MQIQTTNLKDVWLIKPEINNDFRGKYLMYYNAKELKEILPDVDFVEGDIAVSNKHVFRGIHYSPHCWKIYQCINGRIDYVIVNCDKEDSEYGKWQRFLLEPFDMLLKHPRYGAAMWALEDNTILGYLQSQYYNPDNPDQQTFTLKDFSDVWYPNLPYILSKRDEQGHYESGN